MTENISVDGIEGEDRERYRRWVLTRVIAAVLGYGMTVIGFVYDARSLEGLWHFDSITFLLQLVALGFCLVRQEKIAASIVVIAVWLDIHVAMLISPGIPLINTGIALPVLILAVGLWLGRRLANILTMSLVITVPSAFAASELVNLGEGFTAPMSVSVFIGVVMAMFATSAILGGFLHSLEKLLKRSKRNEHRSKELIYGLPDGMIFLNDIGKIRMMNPTCVRLLGLGTSTLNQLEFSDIPWKLSEQATRAAAAAGGEDELRMSSADHGVMLFEALNTGSILEVLAQPLSTLEDEHGLVLVLRDVSERIHAEKKAKELREQLLHSQKMDAVGRLAGGIAHDFNNLLMAIGGYGSLLADSSDPEAREFAAEVLDAQKRGVTLVRQLLTVARKDESQHRYTNLSQLVSGMSLLMKRLLGERSVLQLELDDSCPVLIDPGQMEQVLLNLAANARDAMGTGGSLTVSCRIVDEKVLLSIADNGEGMSEELISRIFEPFYTTKAIGSGTGLRLSTVKDIIETSHGSITVDSKLGVGTVFNILLPLAEETEILQDKNSVHPLPELHEKKIILIEDNEATRGLLLRFLSAAGAEVNLCENGEEALKLFEQLEIEPDLILSDVIMPGCSGVIVVEAAKKRWPMINFLLMSGYLGEAENEPEFDVQHDLIRKPFSREELIQAIAKKLDIP